MSKLKAIAPKLAVPTKPKMLIYGKAGVGKTWTALDFPNVYYIDTEGGASREQYTDKLTQSGGVYFGVEQGSLSLENIIEQVRALGEEEHGFKTLVIDSISKVFNHEVAEEAARLGAKNAFGADKKPAIAMMRRLIHWLTRIDMNVVLIAHEKPQWGVDGKGERTEIGQTYDGWDKLEYELDLCLNVTKNGGMRRAIIKKTRIVEFPEGGNFPWSFNDFAQKYGEEIIQKSAVKLELATADQLIRIKELCKTLSVTQEQKDKWLSMFNVSSFDEMDKEQAEKIINGLRKKISELQEQAA